MVATSVTQKKDGLPSFFYARMNHRSLRLVWKSAKGFVFRALLAHTDQPPRIRRANTRMKIAFFISLAAALFVTATSAQDRIYRCGNEYTNTVTELQARQCKLVSGGNVSVVQAVRPSAAKVASASASGSAAAGPRVDSAEQRFKDSDTRLILGSELKKAEARQVELEKEYNNGEPEKQGPEHRNHQKYTDRIAELKASIERNASDVAGIRRELGRLPAVVSAATGP